MISHRDIVIVMTSSPEICFCIEKMPYRKRVFYAESEKGIRASKGLAANSNILGLPISAAQRWAKSGMPVTHQGRHVQAWPEELNRWLGRETSEPVEIATESTDLSAELKRGLSYVRKQKQAQNKKHAA